MIPLPDNFNVATHFVDRNVQEGRGGKVAIECGNERITYQQLLDNTNRVGNALLALGVRPKERVLLLLLDTPEFLYSFFGAIKIGAIAVPVNTQGRPQDYEYMLNDSRARVAIVSEPLLHHLESIPREKLRYLQEIVVCEIGQGSQPAKQQTSIYHSLRTLMDSASQRLEAALTSKDEPAFWLYSSGSTGPAKGCVHLHHDMVVCCELYAKGILNMNESDRCFSVARLFFAYGLGNTGYFPLGCGATTILNPGRPTPATIFADIERYKPTLFFSVPTNFAALLSHHREDGREFDLSSVRHAVSAGEALPAPLFHRFKERFGVEILDSLGSTETLQMVIANRPGEVRPGSSGKIIPGYEARLVDGNGRDVPTNEIGDLLIKGDSTCCGYWNKHERTKETFAGDWFRTGDKYYQDADGYFWYAGRANDLFKVNGLWLSPAEVESALVSSPAVREAAVVAREDQDGLTKPAAYVVLNAEYAASEELVHELRELVHQKIGGYKQPRWIEFLKEIPKTATGKLQRFKLREMQEQAAESGPAKSAT
ncbi:MAG TPA: benzoate-CoA ligase family protein [Candidatus Methylomirabilis sp.]|nr:benzoate-CoA ligase family protein [Candidatus Methylomirabilis sp.]